MKTLTLRPGVRALTLRPRLSILDGEARTTFHIRCSAPSCWSSMIWCGRSYQVEWMEPLSQVPRVLSYRDQACGRARVTEATNRAARTVQCQSGRMGRGGYLPPLGATRPPRSRCGSLTAIPADGS